MKTLLIIVSIVNCLALFSPATLAQDNSIMTRANDYYTALKRYQQQKGRVSVERLINKGKSVDEKLDEIEALSDADYSLLKMKMKGFTINREEILFIEPDYKYFLKLSRKHGTTADTAYFSLMRKIKPDNVWAAYTEQQTDVTGCTIYGNGLLTRLYGQILNFKQAYPKSFVKNIDEERNEILQAFSVSSCSCGDVNGVLKEFNLFIRTYPKDKNTPEIKKNLANLKKGGDFRFNCQSGYHHRSSTTFSPRGFPANF